MSHLLIYSYVINDYCLVEPKDLLSHRNAEVLFEFGSSELVIAKKVLGNLRLEHQFSASKDELERVA